MRGQCFGYDILFHIINVHPANLKKDHLMCINFVTFFSLKPPASVLKGSEMTPFQSYGPMVSMKKHPRIMSSNGTSLGFILDVSEMMIPNCLKTPSPPP